MLKNLKKNKRLLIVAAALCSVLIAGAVIVKAAVRSKNNVLTVVDGNGEVLATVSNLSVNDSNLKDRNTSTYVKTVIDEAISVIAEKNGYSEEKSKKTLQNSSYTVYTAFDSKALEACSRAYSAFDDSKTPFSAVVMSNDGKLLSVFSGSDESKNYATEKTQPYSAFKPLSVYAPAMEKGLINWSSRYEDSPVKKVLSDSGEYVDWPVNGTGKYTNGNITVCEGIKLSLNTTAVRCLKELGVSNSINFLSDKFNIDISNEKQIISKYGEEEVLANIGLGYLTAGVSPVELTGFYSIFSKGGRYEEPYSVLEIKDDKGKSVYKHTSNETQIISEETACVMNKLLQNTLSEGGTAQKAKVQGVKIGGKTGTGSEHLGNWFVGFTPEYSYSIWHGQRENNDCAELSSYVISGLTHNKEKDFPECSSVREYPYCTESGELLTLNCIDMETGFYSANNLPSKCKMHLEADGDFFQQGE